MNKWLKRGALSLLALAGVAGATFAIAVKAGESKLQRRVEVPTHTLALPADATSLERGRYLFASRGCGECHGADGAGREVINDGKGMRVKSPNISPGPGSVVTAYKVEDWERAIRHGIKPGGQPLFIMPSQDYNRLTDDDVASLVAYARQLPPASGTAALIELPPIVKALYGFGVIPDAAAIIDHKLAPATPVAAGVNAQHGAYVANMCLGCHGANLSGGTIPGVPPDWPPAANLTPGEGSVMARYASAEQFTSMLRTGKRPDGSAVSPVMPFASLAALNDTDVQALYLHLKGLAPRPAGQR